MRKVNFPKTLYVVGEPLDISYETPEDLIEAHKNGEFDGIDVIPVYNLVGVKKIATVLVEEKEPKKNA